MSQQAAQQTADKLETEVKEFRAMRDEFTKLNNARQSLLTQQNENELVKKELELLEPKAAVFKLTGPVLIKQDLADAKANVDKRLQYINDEIKRLEKSFKDLEKKQEEKRTTIMELQSQLQQMHIQSQAKK